MPSQKNIKHLEELNTKLQKAKAVILADYRGLKVNDLGKLRQKLKTADAKLKVIKNSLIKLAFQAQNLDLSQHQDVLVNPTAVIFANQDEIAPLKIIYDFSQTLELPKIKLGFLGKEVITPDRVIELAKLPDKAYLQAKLIGVLASSYSGFIYVLKANLTKLTYVLDQLKIQKGGEI